MIEDQIIIYQTEDGQTSVDMKLESDTIWLTLNQLSLLFERDKSVISKHLHNIYDNGELDRRATIAKNATVQIEGKREINRAIDFYNSDAIISVGYRVNSKRGTQFRKWANTILKDYLVKGYVLNEQN